MTIEDQARAMRADGTTFAAIARALGIRTDVAHRLARHVDSVPRENRTTVIRYHAHNGGCSTLSGMRPVRMPRITALHGFAANGFAA